ALSKHLHLIPLKAELARGLIDRNFVLAGPAGGAAVAGGQFNGGEEPFKRQIGEAIDLDELADLLDGAIVGDQLVLGGEVDAVEAGMADRRATDAQVDFFGSRASECAHL